MERVMSASIDLLAVEDAAVVVEVSDGPTPVADHRAASGRETTVCATAAEVAAAVEPHSVDLVVVPRVDDVSEAAGVLAEGGAVIVCPPEGWSTAAAARLDHAIGENENLRERVISLNDLAEKARWETETIKRSRSYRMLEPLRRLAAKRR